MKNPLSLMKDNYPSTIQFTVIISVILIMVEFFSWMIAIVTAILALILPIGIVSALTKDYYKDSNNQNGN